MIKEADVFFALLSLIIHPMMYKRQKKPPLFHNNPMIILCIFPIHCIRYTSVLSQGLFSCLLWTQILIRRRNQKKSYFESCQAQGHLSTPTQLNSETSEMTLR